MQPCSLAALVMSGSLLMTLPAQAEVLSVTDLARAFAASRTMEATANPSTIDATTAYRAGRFDGYLTGLAERLSAEGAICLPSCFCAVREKIDAELVASFGEPLAIAGQAANLLVERQLRQSFPCRNP